MQSMSKGSKILLNIAMFVVVIAGAKAAQAIIIPFILAGFLAVISAPPFFWLTEKKIPTALSLVIVIGAVILFALLIVSLVSSSVQDFSNSLPYYQSRIVEITSGLLTWLKGFGVDVSSQVVLEYFDPRVAMKLVTRFLTELGGILANGFLILLAVSFMLLESSTFTTKIAVAFGEQTNSQQHIKKFTASLKQYISIKSIMSVITGVIITIFLAVLGVEYPLLWGVLAFLLNYIPNLGSILAAVPAILMALIQLGAGSAAIVAAGYMVINILMGSILEPKYMGRGVGLSTLVVFLSLVFWGWVLGPVGMLLSVPLTMTLKIALESSEDSRWLAVILGSENQYLSPNQSTDKT